MMKKILFILMLLSATSAFAQDVIVKTDGSTILSKVLEITSTEVKYKKFSNLNGPTYTIAKSEIQAINYANGEKEIFYHNATTGTPIIQQARPQNNTWYNQKMIEGMSASNRLQKEKLLANAESWRTVGKVWFWVNLIGGVGTGVILLLNDADDATYWIAAGAGIVSGSAGLILCNVIANNKENAANSISSSHLYQKQFKIGNGRLDAGVDLLSDSHFTTPSPGIGLTYHF